MALKMVMMCLDQHCWVLEEGVKGGGERDWEGVKGTGRREV